MIEKNYEIILYGATGFTGQLCAKYLIDNYADLNWAIAGRDKEQIISFKTNTNDHFLLDEHHPLRVEIKSSTQEPSPYVLVRENLEGLLSRNVYYKLVNISVTRKLKHKKIVGIWSRNKFFELGEP